MKNKIPLLTCALCGNKYQMGKDVYDGQYIKLYDMTVCNNCYILNYDCWGSYYENKILQHLKEKQMPIPKRNSDGCLPRE